MKSDCSGNFCSSRLDSSFRYECRCNLLLFVANASMLPTFQSTFSNSYIKILITCSI
jgi:hypothetical protein